MTKLYLRNSQISDITPLKNLTGLTELRLWRNQISDITPLENLTRLIELHIQQNQISDITPLENLTGLTKLYLGINQISDITPLENLTGLTELRLWGNQISDITPLKNLTGLTKLYLDDNQIIDIQPLVDNPGIDSGDDVSISYNPLGYTAQKIHIPNLEERGVDVWYSAKGTVTLGSAGPLTWSYTLTYEDGYLCNWTYEGAGITDANVTGEAALAGWTVEYQDATRVTFANNTPLEEGSVSGFEITGTQGRIGVWLCGRNSDGISGPATGDCIWFPDANLEALIREVIDKPEGCITDTDLQSITSLNSGGSTPDDEKIANLTGLEYCINLTRLRLGDNHISNITLLANLTRLTELYLWDNQISDISPLENLTGLTELLLAYNQISDITPLENLKGLTRLSLEGNQISDITPLENLTELRSLSLTDNPISDITPLANLTELRFLSLWRNPISDISALANLTELRDLYLGGNQISNISVLANLTRLIELSLGGNPISDITPLANLTELRKLYLGGNPISDISVLANLTELRDLSLTDNQISDITPLANLTRLTELYLGGNQISDITPLANLTELRKLYLFHNQISDISPLENLTGLTELLLADNQISDVTPLENLTGLTRLELYNNPQGIVTLASADPPAGSYTLTHEYGSLYNWTYEGTGITDASVTGEAELAGWTVEYQDATRVTFANSTPLEEGSVSGFEITGAQGGTGTWLCGINSGYIPGPDSSEITLNLYPGMNMISLPRLDVLDAEGDFVTLKKGSDLAGVLRSSLLHIIYLVDGKFKAYIPGVSSDIPLSGEAGYILSMTSANTLVFRGNSWPAGEISLSQGVNLIGLPSKFKGGDTFSTLVNSISGSVSRIIYLEDNKFKNVTDDVVLSGGMGLMVVMESDGSFSYSGAPWSNEVLASPSNTTLFPSSPPVMTVDGTVIGGENGFSLDNLSVTVRHLNSGFSINDNANGKFSVTFIDLFSSYCFSLGDVFEIEISDRAGNYSVDNIRHTVTQEDIQSGRIALGNIIAQRVPKHSQLLANYPNPFNPETWIPYQLAQNAPVTIYIYNTKGQLIRTIALGSKQAGIYATKEKTAYWDGRDSLGEKVASGVYYYQLEAGEFRATRKMVIMK